MKKLVKRIVTLPTILLFGLINKLLKFRFGYILASRIGHFAGDAILYNCNFKLGSNYTDWFFYVDEKPSNLIWEKIFLRNFKVIKSKKAHWFIRNFLLSDTLFPEQFRPSHFNLSTRDFQGLHLKVNHSLKLSNEENEEAIFKLKKMGWQGQPIVALHIRDSGYLQNDPNNKPNDPKAWDYHNYRNSDISTYNKTIQFLVDSNYFVIRLGKYTNKKADVSDKNYIDLWQDGYADDLLDIWVAMNSLFMISTGSGIEVLSIYSRVPLLLVNFLPVAGAYTFCNSMTVPKHLIWKHNNSSLTLKEMLKCNLFYSEEYNKLGINIVDLNEIEIFDACNEFLDRIKHSFISIREDQGVVDKIESHIRKQEDFDKEFGFFHPQFSFGMNWIRSKGPGFLE